MSDREKALREIHSLATCGGDAESLLTQIAAIATPPVERAAEPVRRWPFVESPGEFTLRLWRAYTEFDGDMLAAVRFVLIENPPTLYTEAQPERAAEPVASLGSGDKPPKVDQTPAAWLHTVKQHGDDEEDQAMSFSPDNFPFQADEAPGFYSVGAIPLYTEAQPERAAPAEPFRIQCRPSHLGFFDPVAAPAPEFEPKRTT
jgi:hypothetical protein